MHRIQKQTKGGREIEIEIERRRKVIKKNLPFVRELTRLGIELLYRAIAVNQRRSPPPLSHLSLPLRVHPQLLRLISPDQMSPLLMKEEEESCKRWRGKLAVQEQGSWICINWLQGRTKATRGFLWKFRLTQLR
ncbi:hypothetical protein LINPERPRIM_LOCUS33079 [Linum perenne]